MDICIQMFLNRGTFRPTDAGLPSAIDESQDWDRMNKWLHLTDWGWVSSGGNTEHTLKRQSRSSSSTNEKVFLVFALIFVSPRGGHTSTTFLSIRPMLKLRRPSDVVSYANSHWISKKRIETSRIFLKLHQSRCCVLYSFLVSFFELFDYCSTVIV